MSLDEAKQVFDPRVGDPARNWITTARMKEFVERVYTDMPVDGVTQAEVEALVADAISNVTLTPEQIDTIITQVGDLSSYATADDVSAAIAAAVAGVVTQTDVDSAIQAAITALPAGLTEADVTQAISEALSGLSAPEFDTAKPVTFTDPAVTQQTSGEVLGFDPDGFYNPPEVVGGIPVVVGGVEYLIPLIAK